MTQDLLVDIDSVQVSVKLSRTRRLKIVDYASMQIRRGEMMGLIGESGSGKTMLCRGLIGTLHRRDAYISGGKIMFDGVDLATAKNDVWRAVRGKRIGYVPQSALAGPNPVLTIEAQLYEALRNEPNISRKDLSKRAMELLDIVQIRRPEIVMKQYPSQLSGGMKQRVMIACAIALQPELIVADEPTTGLDVTVQADIMKLLKDIRNQFNTSIILVSHDLPLINDVCDRITVMHAGATIETLPSSEIENSKHPYTIALYKSRIDLAPPRGELITIKGQPPAVGAWQAGCRFNQRCDFVTDACTVGDHPKFIELSPDHHTACINHGSIPAKIGSSR
ncbi:MAG: ABC transporter ATP-binding protein [Candidatus Nanopelagicales bacterium]